MNKNIIFRFLVFSSRSFSHTCGFFSLSLFSFYFGREREDGNHIFKRDVCFFFFIQSWTTNIIINLFLQGHVVTLEITSGQVYRGKLLEGKKREKGKEGESTHLSPLLSLSHKDARRKNCPLIFFRLYPARKPLPTIGSPQFPSPHPFLGPFLLSPSGSPHECRGIDESLFSILLVVGC